MKVIILAALVLVALSAASVSTGGCTMQIRNTLKHDSILLCGRENGGMPGARFSKLLPAGSSFSYPCPETTADKSFETYFAVRNDTKCTWDACKVDTGTCKSYPWVMGEGLSWENGLWYGFVAANFDGAGLGWQGNYGSAAVQYGVQLNCSSYGTSAWNGTCGVHNNEPTCVPNAPNFGLPGTGVVACGPANNEGTISVDIFESI